MILEIKSDYKIVCNNKNIENEIKNIFEKFISYYIVNFDILININNTNYKFKKDDIIQFHYLDFPDNIITINNINNIIEELKGYNNSFVFGKGPTFKNRAKKDNEIYFGVNQTVNILDNCDVFCANDLHNTYKINDFSKIKYVLIPEYLHINGQFDKNGYWFQVYEYLKDKFNGKIIIFNLRTSKYKNKQFINIPNCKTTSNVAVNFICIFLNKFIKKVNTYGIGVNCTQDYNNLFVGNGEYKDNRIKIIRNEIINICNKYNLSLCII